MESLTTVILNSSGETQIFLKNLNAETLAKLVLEKTVFRAALLTPGAALCIPPCTLAVFVGGIEQSSGLLWGFAPASNQTIYTRVRECAEQMALETTFQGRGSSRQWGQYITQEWEVLTQP